MHCFRTNKVDNLAYM